MRVLWSCISFHGLAAPETLPSGARVSPCKNIYHIYNMRFSAFYAVSCRAKPDKAGGWGCNPHTENTRRSILHRSVTKPIQTKRNQTKQSEKESRDKQKTKDLKP